MSELQLTRQARMKVIMQENAIGFEEFAFCLGKDPVALEKLINSSHPKISDSLARLIEQTFSKASFWLDGDVQAQDNFDLFGS